MKILFNTVFAAVVSIGVAASGTAMAQDRLVIQRSQEAIISGFVNDVYYNTFTVQNNPDPDAPPITVTLQDLDLESYNNLDTLINKGMRVTVYGKLINGNTLQASKIVQTDGWAQ